MHHYFLFALLPILALAAPNVQGLSKRSVTCVELGSTQTATWTNAAGETCTVEGVVGSNYGTNPEGTGDYSCNGRCGAGCTGTSVGDAYTADCFTHDMCSYYNSATGGASDPNCGTAYDNAVDDTLLGTADGCGQTNPTSSVVKPTVEPVCA